MNRKPGWLSNTTLAPARIQGPVWHVNPQDIHAIMIMTMHYAVMGTVHPIEVSEDISRGLNVIGHYARSNEVRLHESLNHAYTHINAVKVHYGHVIKRRKYAVMIYVDLENQINGQSWTLRFTSDPE